MAETPPTLDDGERWLPSDIFIAEAPPKRGLTGGTRLPSCMDELAQRFASLTLLRQRNVSKSLLKTPQKRFEPVPVPVPVRLGLENPSSQPCQGCLTVNNGFENVQTLYGYNNPVPKPGYGGSELSYEYQLRKPVQLQPQVGGFLETRAGVLQRQISQNRILQNRFLSSQGSGFAKISGGTGVFHPRVSTENSNIAPTTRSAAFTKKKQVLRHNKPEIQVSSKRNSTSFGLNKDFHYNLTPELSLPKDWTY